MKNTDNLNINSKSFGMPDDTLISQTIRSDAKAFNPPPEAKNEIFKALGMQPPYAPAAGAAGGILALITFFKKSAIPAAAGILAIFLLYYYYNNDSNQQQAENTYANVKSSVNQASKLQNVSHGDQNSAQNNNAAIPMASSIHQIESNKPKVTGFAVNNQNQLTQAENHNISNSPNLNLSDNVAPEVSPARNASENLYQISPNTAVVGAYTLSGYRTYNPKEIFTFNLFNNSYDEAPGKYVIELSLKGIVGTTFDANNKFGDGINKSFVIGAYIPTSNEKQMSVGLLVGNEPFAKKFFNKEYPSVVEYTDNPSTLWLAVAAKYRSNELQLGIMSFRPFAEVALGAGSIGPMSRLSAGIEKQVFANISANISADFSTMFYNNGYKWFVSPKLGVSAGINYTF